MVPENRFSGARPGHASERARENAAHGLRRRFTGVWMPACLWWLPGLSLEAKVILAEVDSLSTEERKGRSGRWSWVENDHLARLTERSERTIQRAIEELSLMRLLEMEMETDPRRPGHRRRWLKVRGEDLADAVRQARERVVTEMTPPDLPRSGGVRNDTTGGDIGDTTAGAAVVSDLTPGKPHSLESENTWERKQQQAEVQGQRTAGRIGGEASSPFPLGWEMRASREKAAAAAGIDNAEKLPDKDGMPPLQFVLPEASPGLLEELLEEGVAYSTAVSITESRTPEWVAGWMREYRSPLSTFKSTLAAVLASKHRKGEDPPGAASSPPCSNPAARPVDPEEKSHAVPSASVTKAYLREMRDAPVLDWDDDKMAEYRAFKQAMKEKWAAQKAGQA